MKFLSMEMGAFGGLITPAHSLLLRLSYPFHQERDALCLVKTLKIWAAQLSCLSSSVGRASA